jgi:hypothetical protein
MLLLASEEQVCIKNIKLFVDLLHLILQIHGINNYKPNFYYDKLLRTTKQGLFVPILDF